MDCINEAFSKQTVLSIVNKGHAQTVLKKVSRHFSNRNHENTINHQAQLGVQILLI